MHTHLDESSPPDAAAPEATPEPPTPTGVPLAPSVRARLERTLAAPLDDVRLHTGATADTLARHASVHGIAYGPDIVLPARAHGHGPLVTEAILAHEAAHVVQQRQRGPLVSTPRAEAAANAAALAHLAGRRAPPQPAAPRGLRFDICDIGPPQVVEGAPADAMVDPDLIDRIEAFPEVERAYEDYAAAPRSHASGYGMMPEGQRYHAALQSAGLDFSDRDRDRRAFLDEFEAYATQWALKMLRDSEALVRREQARYASTPADVQALWTALAPARQVAPEQASREAMAGFASGSGPPAVSRSTLAFLGLASPTAPHPPDPVGDARAEVDTRRFPIAADPDLNASRLSSATSTTFASVLDGICRRRLAAIERARQELLGDPGLVWQLDLAIGMALKGMGATETSVLRPVVMRRMANRQAAGSAALADGAGLFAMLFGLLTGVGGVVGLLGLIGAVAAGGYAAAMRYQDQRWRDAIDETDFDRADALASATSPDMAWVALEIVMIGVDLAGGRLLVRGLAREARALRAAIRSGDTAAVRASRDALDEAALRTSANSEGRVPVEAAEEAAHRVAARAQQAAATDAAADAGGSATRALERRGLTRSQAGAVQQLAGTTETAVRALSDDAVHLVGAVSERSPAFRRGLDTLCEGLSADRFTELMNHIGSLSATGRARRRFVGLIQSVGEAGMTAADVRRAAASASAPNTTTTGRSNNALESALGSQRDARLTTRADAPRAAGEVDSPLRGTDGFADRVRRRGTLAPQLERRPPNWSGADEAEFLGLPSPSGADNWHLARDGRLQYRRPVGDRQTPLAATTEAVAGPHRLPVPEPGYRYQRAPGRNPPFRIQSDPVPSGQPRRQRRELYPLPGGGYGFRDATGRLLDSGRLGRALERELPEGATRPAQHQAHHLAPSEVVRDEELFRTARDLPGGHAYDGDRARNGIFLPDSEAARTGASAQLPIHNTSHTDYSRMARQAAREEWETLVERFLGEATEDAAIRAAVAQHPAEVLQAVARVEDRMRAIVENWVEDQGSRRLH